MPKDDKVREELGTTRVRDDCVFYFGSDENAWILRDPVTGLLTIHFADGTEQTTAVPGAGAAINIPAAEALAIAAGVITPTLPTGLYANVIVSGEGGVDDDLTNIISSAAWIGKRIIIRMANAGAITIKQGFVFITKTDFILNSIYDTAEFECIANGPTRGWIMISRSDNA